MITSLSIPLRIAALAVVLGGSSGVLAKSPGDSTGGRISSDQLQQIFPQNKTLAMRDRQARISILQSGEGCIRGAVNAQALRTCQRNERKAMQERHQRHLAELRQLYERNGIQIPSNWGNRKEKST
jgi:hypothetical protein